MRRSFWRAYFAVAFPSLGAIACPVSKALLDCPCGCAAWELGDKWPGVTLYGPSRKKEKKANTTRARTTNRPEVRIMAEYVIKKGKTDAQRRCRKSLWASFAFRSQAHVEAVDASDHAKHCSSSDHCG